MNNTMTEEERQEDQAAKDAAFLRHVILGNERWNSRGISETDAGVCLEMSHLNDWGPGLTKTRLRAAFDYLKSEAGDVTKTGDRWFAAVNPRTDDAEARKCQGPRCENDIRHLRGNAQFCSPKCRLTAHRKSG